MDPISDMLTRIRNALVVGKKDLNLPYSKQKHALAILMLENGWLEGIEVLENEEAVLKPASSKFKVLKLTLKYKETGRPSIAGLKTVSKPGQRIYTKATDIRRFQTGLGATIISTSKGLMTDAQARKARVGGEVVCQIW